MELFAIHRSSSTLRPTHLRIYKPFLNFQDNGFAFAHGAQLSVPPTEESLFASNDGDANGRSDMMANTRKSVSGT